MELRLANQQFDRKKIIKYSTNEIARLGFNCSSKHLYSIIYYIFFNYNLLYLINFNYYHYSFKNEFIFKLIII